MEEHNGNNTKVYSSSQGEHIIDNVSHWNLPEYLKLIE